LIDSLNTADNNHKYSKFLCIENTIHIFQITTRISWASIIIWWDEWVECKMHYES